MHPLFDGIQKKNLNKPAPGKTVARTKVRTVRMHKPQPKPRVLHAAPRIAMYVTGPWYARPLRYYASRGLVACLVTLAFLSGAWMVWKTEPSRAQEQSAALTSAAPAALAVTEVPAQDIEHISNEVLFSLSLEQLEQYLNEITKMPEEREAEALAQRKEKLTAYLREKKSPFVDYVDTLAVQPHWKLILAISNAESSLGKRCHSNNCSGIGVEPGHPLWREYDSLADWMVSLNRLLERRYKDWTLEKMNGVYVQPGSKNWLMATKQILQELEERGIQ